ISDPLVERLRDVLASPRIGEGKKRRLTEQFIATYDLYSESRYLLSPLALKSFLGSRVLEGEYVGIFHFHNDAEPPSEPDVKASGRDRQIVVSLTDEGFILYDLVRGDEKAVRVSVSAGTS
ncbi:MAG: hypothetical protein HY760_09275, partial [Nitrospirae bacterium]|nr:hypothetical protein [Nitrospirota bacterium]